VQVVIKDYQMR